MENHKLSKCMALLAIVCFIAAIIGKLAFSWDPVILACCGGIMVGCAAVIGQKSEK